MGASFLFAVLPACVLTKERRQQLLAIIDKMDDSTEFSSCVFPDEEDLDAIKEALKTDVGIYEKLDTFRDTGGYTPDGSFPLLLTGGMSWGDPPTDSYDILNELAAVPDIWNALAKWAREDATESDDEK